MDELQLLRGNDYIINQHITIHQPTLDEICQYGEQEYFGLITTLTTTPSDIKSVLFDIGIDFECITDFELFALTSKKLTSDKTEILFGKYIDFSKLVVCENIDNNELIMVECDEFGEVIKDGIKIDPHIHSLFTDLLRTIHGLKKNNEKAGNELTKNILIEEDRENRKQQHSFKSCIKPLIIPMVNCADFKYDFNTIWQLPISLFFDCVKQIQKLKDFEFVMQGVYSGNIDVSKINKNELTWI